MLKNILFNLSTEAVTDAVNMDFNPQGFLDQLPTMGLGMLGIFIVIAIIMGATYLINFIFRPRNKTPKN